MTTEADQQTQSMPVDMAEACRWITQLRDAYQREATYSERLGRQIAMDRRVVEIAGWWHHARGMHRAPWLERLKAAIVEWEVNKTDVY